MMDTILSGPPAPSAFRPSPVPQKAGVGLKPQHVETILATKADIGFFEIHAENYMGGGGLPHSQLSRIREGYPVSIHGVGMSIGGENRIDRDHLARFRAVVDRYQPGLVSEHLAWSTHDDVFYNDLLPLPYTSETLARVVRHIDQVQETIGRQILIENPSTYVTFNESNWSEFEFMAEIAYRSGCGLLFDVNNVYVSAINHGYSPEAYIDEYPLDKVREIHLAGHATDADNLDHPLLIDSHDRPVASSVWALFERVLQRTGPLPSLVEWDNDVPAWEVLANEARRAQTKLDDVLQSIKDQRIA